MVERLLVIMYDFLHLTLGGVNTSYAQTLLHEQRVTHLACLV